MDAERTREKSKNEIQGRRHQEQINKGRPEAKIGTRESKPVEGARIGKSGIRSLKLGTDEWNMRGIHIFKQL